MLNLNLTEEEKQDILNIGKLLIYKNALIYQNSIIQISNICSVWLADKSYIRKNALPMWIVVLAISGGLISIFGMTKENEIVVLLGLLFCIVAGVGKYQHKPTTSIAKFALGVERSSGRIMLFSSPDKTFVLQAIKAIMNAMSEKKSSSDMVVMNFDNKKINIESVTGSNIISGDVNNSLVESMNGEPNKDQ